MLDRLSPGWLFPDAVQKELDELREKLSGEGNDVDDKRPPARVGKVPAGSSVDAEALPWKVD